MVFYNLTSKELDSMRHNISYGTKEYFEYSLVKMVDSVYCYNHYGNTYDKYLNNKYMKCSMESHISHILADLFTARPKAYSENGLRKLLCLRLLKINGINIKELYLNNLINPLKKNNEINNLKINANKIIFPTDTKTNKYLNDFYNTGFKTFDCIQKEETNFI